MINPRLIREQDAQLQMEVMSWLIQNYGGPSRPPVPSPLHKAIGSESLAWKERDTRSIFDWADDHFYAIQSECNLGDINIELIPAGDGLTPSQVSASHRLSALSAGRNPYTQPAQAEVYYDPRDCIEAGYFPARVILQLADIRVQNFRSEHSLSPIMQRMVTLVSAAFIRQGFVLAQLPHEVSKFMTAESDLRAVPHRLVINSLCYATCLALRIRRQSSEQIIATYGTRMSKTFRRKVKQACRQIDSYQSDLATLQLIAEPTPKQAINPYRLQQTG